MKAIWITFMMVFLVGCEQEQKSSGAFADRIVDFAIANPQDQFIELPDLYEQKATQIPEAKEDQLILVDKLQAKGFKITTSENNTYSLSGVHTITVKLATETCACEVRKMYYSTPFVNQFTVTEKIKCRDLSRLESSR